MDKRKKAIIHKGAWLLFIIYIVSMVYFLFLSEHYGRSTGAEGYRYNLKLFKEITRFIKYRNQLGLESFVVNIFGNILAFAPFGFVLPIISPKNRKFFNILLLSFELTLTIEILQLLLKVGIFDVDDMFMNTIGGVLGYLFFAFCYRIYKKHR